MKVWTWILLGVCGASTFSVACSDDDGSTDGAGGAPTDAGASGDSSLGGGSSGDGAGGVSTSGGGGDAGAGPLGAGGLAGGEGGTGAGGDTSLGGNGGQGGVAVGGQGDVAVGGQGGVAVGGQGGAHDVPSLACPAIGQTVTYSALETYSDEVYEAASRVGCDLSDNRDLEIRRFQVTAQSVFVAYARHTLMDYFEAMRLDEDCGPNGVVQPESSNPFVVYPEMVVELLEPGIYTSVSCSTRVETLLEAPPAPPSNVDCAHAEPLGSAKLPESRVLDASSRFYRVTVSEPNPDEPDTVKSRLLVSFATAQTNSDASGTLTGMTTVFPAQADHLPYMVPGAPLAWGNLAPGDYCLEIGARPGTKYDITARVESL